MMNGQIVLCRGVNDGEELDRSIPGFGNADAGASERVGGTGGAYPLS